MNLWCGSIDNELESSHPLLVLLLRDLLLPVVKPEPLVLVLVVLALDSLEIPHREIFDAAGKRRDGDSDSTWVGSLDQGGGTEDVGSTEGDRQERKGDSTSVDVDEGERGRGRERD